MTGKDKLKEEGRFSTREQAYTGGKLLDGTE